MDERPPELLSPPLPLVSIAGAVVLHPQLVEALHEAAEAACNQRRAKYLSVDYDFQLPPVKRGAKDQPGYRAAGILKRRWLEKVCHHVPAVLVVCFDWSADPQLENPLEAASQQLQHARRQIYHREVRLLVLCIVHPGTADPDGLCGQLRGERDVSGLVVAKGEHDLFSKGGKAQKLERMIIQSAMLFYGEEEKRQRKVRSPRAVVLLRTSQALQARVHFKVGFLCEFRKNTRDALNSYIKAYEMLIRDTDIADVVERVSLCNHLTFRMYQLYLHSHDVKAAVHHCRIHTSTIRSCCPDSGGAVLVWRRWHWLSDNHQLFAQLLESVAQQAPLLLDHSDMWQAPSFHLQAAAEYVLRLREWARSEHANIVPTLNGGALDPSLYIGQAPQLERPEEVSDPSAEVATRLAKKQAQEVRQSDRCQQLLLHSQRVCQERGHASGVVTSVARLAEEYIAECNPSVAYRLLDRLRPVGSQPDTASTKPIWPALHRFALERAILCSCTVLNLPAPSICWASRGTPCMQDRSESEGICDSASLAQSRGRLACDAFEYLSLHASKDSNASVSLPGAQQAELLRVVRSAFGQDGQDHSEARTDVEFDGAIAEVEMSAEHQSEASSMRVRLKSPLAVPLEVHGVTAATSSGDAPLSLLPGGASIPWQEGQDLELEGTLSSAVDTSGSPLTVFALRLCWTSAPGLTFVVRNTRCPEQSIVKAFQLPSLAPALEARHPFSPSLKSPQQVSSEGTADLSLQLVSMVDPYAAIVEECFVIHAAIAVKSVSDAPGSTEKLFLSCSLISATGTNVQGDEAMDAASVWLLAEDHGTAEDCLIPCESPRSGIHVANVVTGSSGKRCFAREAASTVLSVQGAEGGACNEEALLQVPIIVRSRRALSVRLVVQVRSVSASKRVALESAELSLCFNAGIHVSFEDRILSATPAGGGFALKKCMVRSLARVGLRLRSAQIVGSTNPTSRSTLGIVGDLAPQAIHVFTVPPVPQASNSRPEAFALSFERAGALEAFFPPAYQGRGIRLPPAFLEFQLPPSGSSAAVALAVELDHSATGTVAEAFEMLAHIRRPGVSEFALKLLPDAGDRLLIAGPTSCQGVLVDDQSATFTIIPLRPGRLVLPRLQVTVDGQEATSTPSSIFVYPTQPVLWRASE